MKPKRSHTKKSHAKKSHAKRQQHKKSNPKKSPVKKSPVKKSPVKKSPVKKSPVKKSPVKKSPVKKSPVKRSPAKRSSVKKSAFRKKRFKKFEVKEVEQSQDLTQYSFYREIERVRNWNADTIADILKSQIKSVEGPISISILKPTTKLNKILGREGPVYLLFGDMHVGNFRCKDDCLMKDNCFSFYMNNPSIVNFLNTIGKHIHTDLFFEMWLSKHRRHNLYRENFDNRNQKFLGREATSALNEIRGYLVHCLSYDPNLKKKCKALNFYVHMSDPRHLEQDNIDGLLREHMSYESYEEFKSLWKKNFNDFSLNEFLNLVWERVRLGPEEFLKKFIRHHPMFVKHSKINKQLSKIPNELQDIFYNDYIQDNFDNKCQLPQNVKSISHLDERLKYNYLKDIVAYKKDKYDNEVNKCYWSGDIADLDLYFLGRSLKIPENGPYTKLGVAYFGDHHVRNITNLLVNHDLMTEYYIVSNRNEDPWNKCVI